MSTTHSLFYHIKGNTIEIQVDDTGKVLNLWVAGELISPTISPIDLIVKVIGKQRIDDDRRARIATLHRAT